MDRGQEVGNGAPWGSTERLFGKDLPTLNDLDGCWSAAALPYPASKASSSPSPGSEDAGEVGNSAFYVSFFRRVSVA